MTTKFSEPEVQDVQDARSERVHVHVQEDEPFDALGRQPYHFRLPARRRWRRPGAVPAAGAAGAAPERRTCTSRDRTAVMSAAFAGSASAVGAPGRRMASARAGAVGGDAPVQGFRDGLPRPGGPLRGPASGRHRTRPGQGKP